MVIFMAMYACVWEGGRVWQRYLARCVLTKCSFHSSVHWLQSCQNGRLTKMGSRATSGKIQKLSQQTFREDYQTNMHTL